MPPPFRADHVGSLLRPSELLEARERAKTGAISAEELRAQEDDAIRDVIRKQEAVGLNSITDGDFRRADWFMDFILQIGGVKAGPAVPAKFRASDGAEVIEASIFPSAVVAGPLQLNEPIYGADFAFTKANTTKVAKLTIPAPSKLYPYLRGADGQRIYPDAERFFADVVSIYAQQIAALGELGCTYLQIDETSFATLNDPNERVRQAAWSDGAIRAEELPGLYARLINESIANKPSNMTVCVHSCRGNYRSMWRASGDYEFTAEAIFSRLNVDGFFLEYDDERSGGFAPLRFIPPGKRVVLGLVSSKHGRLEDKDELKRRIEEAAKYVALDLLCLSTQCGFASTMQGNVLTEEDELRKLALIVEVAHEVWGSAD